MKNLLKKLTRHMVHGIGYGSFIYLAILAYYSGGNQPIAVTAIDILAIMVMSALIGAVTTVFAIDRVPYLVGIIIHFIATAVIVVATDMFTNVFDKSTGTITFWIIYGIAYLAVWIIEIINQQLKVDKINAAIAKRKK